MEGLDTVPGPKKWAPIFKELVKCTPPNTIVNFELLWRNPQPSWCSPGARVVQIGDSAHSYLPASSNGATQAIEDAVSLASCLQIGGRDNVPQSVRAHIRMRSVSFDLLWNTKADKCQIRTQHMCPKTRLLQRRAASRHEMGDGQA